MLDMSDSPQRHTLSTPKSAASFLRPYFINVATERFVIIALDKDKAFIGDIKIYGDEDTVKLDFHEMLRDVITLESSGIILAHNHPSGLCTASQADISVTRHVRSICNMIDVKCLDHIIFTTDQYYSFREHNLM